MFGPKGLVANEEMRQHGWRVFRSSTRDRTIPLTGVGGSLQRIKISEALPVLGVYEGAALSDEERKAAANQRSLALALAERDAAGRPLGVTQYMNADMAVIDGVVDPVNPFLSGSIIGFAPFDGFITEVVINDTSSTPALAWGVRTSGGQTLFRANDPGLSPPPIFRIEPDFIRMNMLSDGGGQVGLRNVKMPVFAGEQITAVTIVPAATPLGTFCGQIVLGFEAFILARPGSAAAVSMFGALTVEARRAATEAAAQSSRLSIEQEKTRRAMGTDAARIEVARINAEMKRQAGQPQFNPFQNLLLLDAAQKQLASRAPVPPPAPRVAAPSKVSPEGTGKTFVSAWNPSYGMIGYLIPNPPRGGKVNVFDNKYSVFDITGKLVSQGAIEPIASDSDIPPGAAISPVRSGTLSAGIKAAQIGG